MATRLTLFASSQDTALNPVRDLLRNSTEWCRMMQRVGQKVNLHTSYEDLREQITTLKTPTKALVDSSASNEVVDSLMRAFKARKRWSEERQKPSRKPGAWVQHWLSTFGQFLSSYNGIVEVIKSADQQFGGLAYGTLAILLAVPINKDQHERDIEDALDEFGLAFPRLQSLQAIYPNKSDNFKSLVARVYAEVISFAQMCANYFLKTSLGRVKDVILTSITDVQAKIREIRRLLGETRWETEVLMMRRIKNAFELLHQKEEEDQRRSLAKLKVALKIQEGDPHVDVASYKALLDGTFSDFVSRYQDPCTIAR